MRAPEFWRHKHGALSAPFTRTLLTPLSWLVMMAGRWRQRTIIAQNVSIPVLCLGNITLGGTGKTPLAISLCTLFQEHGHHPAFLTRGYGGRLRGPVQVDTITHCAKDVGDEALLLARTAPTILARDRVLGAKAAVALGADLIIMDDGFQNPALFKDMSLLVMDTDGGFGNGRVFPAGPLREPVHDALGRAQALIVMGRGKIKPDTVLPIISAQLINPMAPPKGPLIAFAGIGRPQKFFAALRQSGANPVQEIAFDDHHVYRTGEIARLHSWAKAENANLITTEKDYVRLPTPLREDITPWPVEAQFDDPKALLSLLAPVLNKVPPK